MRAVALVSHEVIWKQQARLAAPPVVFSTSVVLRNFVKRKAKFYKPKV